MQPVKTSAKPLKTGTKLEATKSLSRVQTLKKVKPLTRVTTLKAQF